jgi:hypothetical protein
MKGYAMVKIYALGLSIYMSRTISERAPWCLLPK